MIDGLAFGVPFWYTNGGVIESDKGVKLGSTGGGLLRFTLGVDCGYTLKLMKGLISDFFLIL